MNRYHVWAEHTAGASVGHPCTAGVYSDPTDQWSEEIEAENEDSAREIAHAKLAETLKDAEPCGCEFHHCPGSDRWWNSVHITVSRKPYPNYQSDEDADRNPNILKAKESDEFKETANLRDIWNFITTPIARVVDEDGVNVYGAQCRRLTKDFWIYVDDTDGFQIMSESDVERLIVVPDELHEPYGWTQTGEVIPL